MANYEIIKNEKFGSIEIKFEGKPVESVRTLLKEAHFRWNRKTSMWYGYMPEENMVKLLGDTVEYDTTAPKGKKSKSEQGKTDDSAALDSLFCDEQPAPADDDSVEYHVRRKDGSFDKRTGKHDLDSGCVIEKIGAEWVATDYLSGMSVCREKTKKSLMAKLSDMGEKLAAVRGTERYQAMCEALAKVA